MWPPCPLQPSLLASATRFLFITALHSVARLLAGNASYMVCGSITAPTRPLVFRRLRPLKAGHEAPDTLGTSSQAALCPAIFCPLPSLKEKGGNPASNGRCGIRLPLPCGCLLRPCQRLAELKPHNKVWSNLFKGFWTSEVHTKAGLTRNTGMQISWREPGSEFPVLPLGIPMPPAHLRTPEPCKSPGHFPAAPISQSRETGNTEQMSAAWGRRAVSLTGGDCPAVCF